MAVLLDGKQRSHFRDAIAPALLAGSDRDAPPVRNPGDRALALQPHHAFLSEERLDDRHAELDRLLHGEVHLLARRHALHEGDAKRRFALYVAPGFNLD